MKHWNQDEASGLKAQGMGFTDIGKIFGMSYYQARAKLDPVWLEKRRGQINANREPTHSLGKRDHVQHAAPEPATVIHLDTRPFMTASGILAYRKEIWERDSQLGGAVDGEVRTKGISLPWVSILGERHHRYGEGV